MMTRAAFFIVYMAACFALGYMASEVSWWLLLSLPPLVASYVALDRGRVKAKPRASERVREEVRF